jgi:DNA-binding transcriptional LysR family regulator
VCSRQRRPASRGGPCTKERVTEYRPMNLPDWTTLRIFLAAIECGSVTRASEKCGIAVSAAAKRIQDLETELGVQLLTRGARGVTPTVAGELLARHARTMFAFGARLGEDLRAVAEGGLGSVRLHATLSVLAGHPLAEALAAFAVEHPGVSVELREVTSLSVLQNLVEGQTDIGIITVGGAVPNGLEARSWRSDQLLVVMPKGHELATRQSLRFAEVLGHPLIEIIEGGAMTLLLQEAAEHLGVRLRPRLRVATVEAAARLVAAGHDLAIIPDGVLPTYNPDLRLVGVRLAEPWARRQVRLVSRPATMLTPSARLLLDYLSASQGDPAEVERSRTTDAVSAK